MVVSTRLILCWIELTAVSFPQKLRVSISMELEGVTNVRPADDDYEYFFTVMCSSCREVHPKTDEHEISGSKGSANFVWRCTNCKKEHSASFLPSAPKSKSTAPLPYSSSSQFSSFVTLDCRGLEFTEFHLRRGKWVCEGEDSGKAFQIDWDELAQEGEERWDDYDEDKGETVGVSELKSKVERA
ncbi:hypothetical protein I350_06380 [Cryptococcus amylolentus CBS 6273]|uniref:DUF866-domain-containing protein n=1 Tax=Cryptococcus amylolentus CBS 6273 TaxID=1296118 RepID=A0A1E3JL27_9TREE|nr:hypothetical protein I350_06380 [Cryptococcus amylolentus CBS 6273]